MIVDVLEDANVGEYTHILRLSHEGEISTLFCGPKTLKLMRDIELFSSQLSVLGMMDPD